MKRKTIDRRLREEKQRIEGIESMERWILERKRKEEEWKEFCEKNKGNPTFDEYLMQRKEFFEDFRKNLVVITTPTGAKLLNELKEKEENE